MSTFSGKTVYITGGSSGIGLATAEHLAALGADILIMARQQPALDRAIEALETHRLTPDQAFHALSLDVVDQVRVNEEMAAVVEKIGPPDILILSAGINTAPDHFERIDYDRFNRIMDVNVNGVRNFVHALAGPMKAVNGHLVVLSSAAALFGMYGYTAYAASKAALMGYAESLRYELKPEGVTVTIVFPPDVDTPMNYDETKTLPPQGQAMKKMAGMLTPEFTAKEIVRAIERKKYFAIPGRLTRFLYFFHRLTNGAISRLVSDIIIRRASGEKK